MTRILRLDSSITGGNSISRQLTQRIIDQLVAKDPEAAVAERDLVAEPLPHLTLDALADRSVLDEFLAADVVVIGAPMYNFTLPSQLKAWLDRILMAGVTFRYLPDGTPEGLVGGKRVIIGLSRGGFYGPGSPSAELEHLETYLRSVFGFIGITPEFIAADGIAAGPELKAEGVRQALGEVDKLAA